MAMLFDQSDTISATEIDAVTLQGLYAILAKNVAPQLVGDGGEAIAVPPALLTILRKMLGTLGKGRIVEVTDKPDRISVQDAAELLNIFPASVMDLVQKGTIRSIDDGVVSLADVVKYRHEQSQRAKAALDELVRISEDMGLYDIPLSSEDLVNQSHQDEPQDTLE